MRREKQTLRPRAKDQNSSGEFARSVALSIFLHILCVAVIYLLGMRTAQPKMVVPGYKVDLVSLSKKPSSLLTEKKSAKKKRSVKKKSPKKKKVKSRPKKKRTVKKKSHKKKIVPKKTKTKKARPKKEVAPRAKQKPKKVKQEAKENRPKSSSMTGGVEFPYMWYLKIIERKVNENWITHGLDVSGMRRDPTVSFMIERNGEVSSLVLEKSSGSAALDRSALDAVSGSAPFPPLPSEYKNALLPVFFSFSYQQRIE